MKTTHPAWKEDYRFHIGDLVRVEVEHPTGLEHIEDTYMLHQVGAVLERFRVKGYPVYRVDIGPDDMNNWVFSEEQLSMIIPDPSKGT